ncbi:hypothetical protein L6452_43134 [Arctium lappa]|uniref:Uncharacterized protein n=1 Tax=Arctium lappa TaxID=4217 RepID=A0ACB8XK75_ARCLA|nr:hypothetical protein L6452_43134 [Arctium lappa]
MDLATMSHSACVRFNSDSECEIPVSKDVVMNMAEVKFYSDSESESEIPVSKNVSKAAVIRKRRGSKDDSHGTSGQNRKQTRVIHGTSGQKQDQTRARHSHGVGDHETSILVGHHNENSIGHLELHSRDVFAPLVPQERPSTSMGSIQDSIGHVELHSRDVSAPSLAQERSSTSRVSIQDSIRHVELHSRDISGPSVTQDPNSTPDRRKLSTDDVLNKNGHPEISKNEISSPSRGSIHDLHSSTDIKSDLPKSDGVNDHNASSSCQTPLKRKHEA